MSIFTRNQYILFIAIGLLSIQKGRAQDLTPPDTPVIDSVTVLWENPVNPNGDVLITWQACDSTDVRMYYIKYLNEVLGTYKLLDSVDASVTSYLDTKIVTDPHYPQTYVIQAIDFNDNASYHSEQHKTVRVFPWQEEVNCKVQVDLKWNNYEGWSEGIDHYKLYVEQNGQTELIGQYDGTTNNITYPISSETTYYFFARVYSHNGRSSTSNKIPFTPVLPNVPQYIYPIYISVEGEQIHMQFEVDPTADIKNYRLIRSENMGESFQVLSQINQFNAAIFDYTDAQVDVNQTQYLYQLQLLDNCEQVIDTSVRISNILLKAEANTVQVSNQIWWSEYINDEFGIKEYNLIRNNYISLPLTIYSSENVFVYTDNLLNQSYEDFIGNFCYHIEVADGLYVLHSNEVCVSQAPHLMMPTAFSPKGGMQNRIFKPKMVFISPEHYYFSVYDRWGEKIFETTDYKKGWDGYSGSNLYPTGYYMYYLEYYSATGEKFVDTGSFYLMN
ncbi:MAG: gliding motility-associated C-terminal domain-containing protein [Bacteroidales bacterium]|nr:gliding motility-associated C-terminal domain-containing protein [Bacteroidales bacterium]